VEEHPPVVVDNIQAGRAELQDFAELVLLFGDLHLAFL
jgi:hypothetical protein